MKGLVPFEESIEKHWIGVGVRPYLKALFPDWMNDTVWYEGEKRAIAKGILKKGFYDRGVSSFQILI